MTEILPCMRSKLMYQKPEGRSIIWALSTIQLVAIRCSDKFGSFQRPEGRGGVIKQLSIFLPLLSLFHIDKCHPVKKKKNSWSPEKPRSCVGWKLQQHIANRFPLDNGRKQAGVKQSMFKKEDYEENHTSWPNALTTITWQTTGNEKSCPWVADSRGEQSAFACSLCDKKWDGGRVIKSVRDKRELIQTPLIKRLIH